MHAAWLTRMTPTASPTLPPAPSSSHINCPSLLVSNCPLYDTLVSCQLKLLNRHNGICSLFFTACPPCLFLPTGRYRPQLQSCRCLAALQTFFRCQNANGDFSTTG